MAKKTSGVVAKIVQRVHVATKRSPEGAIRSLPLAERKIIDEAIDALESAGGHFSVKALADAISDEIGKPIDRNMIYRHIDWRKRQRAKGS